VRAALVRSGWFAPVAPEVADPDFRARVTLRHYGGFPYGIVLSAATLFLLPTRVERQIAVNMTLYEPDSLPARCAVRSTYRVWYQAFAPFVGQRPTAYEADLVERLTLVCLDELLESLDRREPED
jgi:hypothetical protein